MNNSKRILIVSSTLVFLVTGCGVKEGAEFYTLQKQDHKLTETVSNLQVQVEILMAENNGLRTGLATNSEAVRLLVQDERQHELDFQKLQEQLSKIQKQIKQ
jgi:hypothetical protein